MPKLEELWFLGAVALIMSYFLGKTWEPFAMAMRILIAPILFALLYGTV